MLVNQTMGLPLAPEDVATLESHTEGWITGLQMAALSMQGRADKRAFIKAFAGSHRYVLDYLVDEVLQRQPEPVRRFVEMSHPSASVRLLVRRRDGTAWSAQAMLDYLERANLFDAPLDDGRQWYRYHHLFAEVLHAHTQGQHPATLPPLHQRASAWYEAHDMPGDAIHHALAAGEIVEIGTIEHFFTDPQHRSHEALPGADSEIACPYQVPGSLTPVQGRLREPSAWFIHTGNEKLAPVEH